MLFEKSNLIYIFWHTKKYFNIMFRYKPITNDVFEFIMASVLPSLVSRSLLIQFPIQMFSILGGPRWRVHFVETALIQGIFLFFSQEEEPVKPQKAKRRGRKRTRVDSDSDD